MRPLIQIQKLWVLAEGRIQSPMIVSFYKMYDFRLPSYRHEEGHRSPTGDGIVIDVCKEPTNNGYCARCRDPAQQAKDQEEGPIWRNSTGHGEDSEEHERCDHDDLSTVRLAERRKDYRTKDVANEEKRNRENKLRLTGNMKIFSNIFDRSTG